MLRDSCVPQAAAMLGWDLEQTARQRAMKDAA
jgi:hypothetical protein